MKLVALIVAGVLTASCSQMQAPQLSEVSLACMRIDETYPFHELIADGYDVSYDSDVWYLNGESIGYAENEDEAFVACGPVDLIDVLYNYGDNK